MSEDEKHAQNSQISGLAFFYLAKFVKLNTSTFSTASATLLAQVRYHRCLSKMAEHVEPTWVELQI